MPSNVFYPIGGMNQDDSLVNPNAETGRNAFEEGDYLYGLNLRNTYGDGENEMGTTEVTSYYVRSGGAWTAGTRPTGTEKVIGKYRNSEHRRVYYAVYNASGNHCIRYYDPINNRVYELLKWSGLAFTSTIWVSMSMVDNWLSLTDRTNAPRLMDVDAISDLFNTLTVTNFREFHISFVKWAPVMPPIVRRYYDGATNNYEKFKNKVLQFRYKYIYKGKLHSRWSPSSVAAENFSLDIALARPITAIELYLPGMFLDVPGANTQYNYFGHDNIKFTSAVERIEIAYRESQLEPWKSFKTHTVQASGNTIFRFTGAFTGIPIASSDIDQPFDTVPLLAGSVESVDNRFVFGDCLDELDPAMTPVVTDVGYVKSDGQSTISYWNIGLDNITSPFGGLSAGDSVELIKRNAVSDLTFKIRGQYKPAIIWFHHTGRYQAGYTTDNWFYEVPDDTVASAGEEVGLTFKFHASFVPPSWAVGFMIVRSNCINIDYHMIGIPNSFEPLIDLATQDNYIASLPEEIRSRVREHFENARLVTGTEFKDFVDKTQREQFESSLQDRKNYLNVLKIKPFIHSIASYMRQTGPSATINGASRIYIDLNNWTNASKSNASGSTNNPLNKLFYNYREGDRIRFTGAEVSNPTASQKKRYDVPILEFNGRGIVIEKPKNLVWLPWTTDPMSTTDAKIEVYTPNIPESSDFIYYEVGEFYPVLYPGHASRDFAKRDWTYTNNNAVTANTYGNFVVFNKFPFNKGDCHFFPKTYYRNVTSGQISAFNLGTCSMNQSEEETFGQWERGNGRPVFAYTELPVSRFKTGMMRFGGKIIEESFINRLNRFRDQDQFIYPSEFGRIRIIVNTGNAQVESAGSILLVIGEREAFSVYVNRRTLQDLSGRTIIEESDKVLGSFNVLLGSHGTFNPESVTVERGRVYWWDAINGAWIQYGRNGAIDISSEKMSTWFGDIGDLLISKYGTAENPQVISGFDKYNGELVTYMNHSALPATFRDYAIYKGARYDQDQRRWKSCHAYTPEAMSCIDDKFISFKSGSVWTHETNAAHSTFYGSKYDVLIEPVFNQNPKDMKDWKNLGLVATHGWSVERFLSEYRGAKTKQQSSLALASFTPKEDQFFGAIPKDQNSPNQANPTINGNAMRSKALRALMKLDPAVVTQSLLHYVTVNPVESPKNP